MMNKRRRDSEILSFLRTVSRTVSRSSAFLSGAATVGAGCRSDGSTPPDSKSAASAASVTRLVAMCVCCFLALVILRFERCTHLLRVLAVN